MKRHLTAPILLAAIAVALPALAGPHEPAAASPADAQVHDLERMCEANADARAARHAEQTLFERLGGEAGIHRLTDEIVRLHLRNDAIGHMFADTDPDLVADRVARFMISGMGGPPVYENRPTLPDSHRHLELTNADFMAAGADVIQAMKNLGHGQDEIDEVVCALVGLRSQVVLSGEPRGASHH